MRRIQVGSENVGVELLKKQTLEGWTGKTLYTEHSGESLWIGS